MIGIYKEYHTAYWCIGIALIIGMLTVFALNPHMSWGFVVLVVILALLLVIVNATFFLKLTTKRLSKEVMVLLEDCRANEYVDTLKRLFKNPKGGNLAMYNTLLARGYVVLDDYDSLYECCQNIRTKSYQTEYHKYMCDYYINKEQYELARNELDELKKLAENLKNANYKALTEKSIKDLELSIRIRHGNYDGAEEHYLSVLEKLGDSTKLGKVSYSYALGKLLVLKGDPVRAEEYLKFASENGGDTKYKKYADERLSQL